MLRRLYPKAYISSLNEISADYLKKKGIKGLIFDLDNTLLPWRAGIISPETIEILDHFRGAGINLCVVSNAKHKRVNGLMEPLGIPGFSMAAKPRGKSFYKAMEMMGTKPAETAIIGDQLFTDILGGNRIGLYTILVVPMCKKEFIVTKVVRILEKRVLNKLVRDGVIEFPSMCK